MDCGRSDPVCGEPSDKYLPESAYMRRSIETIRVRGKITERLSEAYPTVQVRSPSARSHRQAPPLRGSNFQTVP